MSTRALLTGIAVLLLATGTAHAIEYPYKEDSPERDWYLQSSIAHASTIRTISLTEAARNFWLFVNVGYS
jgi:hypothetical protein